jgi:hypothetical protein
LRSLVSFTLRLIFCSGIFSDPIHFGYEAGLWAQSRS